LPTGLHIKEHYAMTHAAVTDSLAERMQDLGGIEAARVRSSPAPGTATLNDLIDANDHSKPLCELIDNTLVEKAVGFEASVVAATIIRVVSEFVTSRQLGIVSGPDGMFRLLASSVRAPDVAFLSRDRFPAGQFPREAYPSLAPDLAIEVLSPGNTKAELMRKRIEFFHSGVRLVWIVDCRNRSVAIYTSPVDVIVLDEDATITGGDVLPEFECVVGEFFRDLDPPSLKTT
jgi:Uma2 family endonuclease